MEIFGFVLIVVLFIAAALLMNLRGKAWQDFVDRLNKGKHKK